MAEAIGTALARLGIGEATASPKQSIVDWDSVDLTVLTDLPDRLDDATLGQVERIAQLQLPALPPAPEDHFLKCMRMLRLLPNRGDDDLSGELRLALYRRHFGRYSEAALSFLVEHATMECRFFPSPAECKAILDRWTRRDSPALAVDYARTRARQERERRFDDAMRQFRDGEMTQGQADALPERWRRIAMTQGYLRDDGSLRPIKRWEEQKGVAPAVSRDQHTGAREKAPQPHERTRP